MKFKVGDIVRVRPTVLSTVWKILVPGSLHRVYFVTTSYMYITKNAKGIQPGEFILADGWYPDHFELVDDVSELELLVYDLKD